MVISINNYSHCIPYVMDGEKFVLKTIFRDKYLNTYWQTQLI
jgi:hypothetical protein